MILFTRVLAALVFALGLLGCGVAAKMILQKSQSEKTDVFTEGTGEGAVPAGFAELIIKAGVKTHREGYYRFESKESPHGKPGYPFLLNIDDQAAVWKVAGKLETLPLYDAKGKRSKAPEAGAGMKYILEKRLRVRAGRHTLFFGLPADDRYVEIPLILSEGKAYVLEFEPVYRHTTQPTRIPTFLKGISGIKVLMDDKYIRQND